MVLLETLLYVFVIYPVAGVTSLAVFSGLLTLAGRKFAKEDPPRVHRGGETGTTTSTSAFTRRGNITYTLYLPFVVYIRVEHPSGQILDEGITFKGGANCYAGFHLKQPNAGDLRVAALSNTKTGEVPD
jgi:hypothetical protein